MLISLCQKKLRFPLPRDSSLRTLTLTRSRIHAGTVPTDRSFSFSSLHEVENAFVAMNVFPVLLMEIFSFAVCFAQNLTCYQCIKNSNEECGPEHLLPCPKVADRCVTHISKHVDKGYLIKRECGLGPCDFGDDMANKGLGMDGCDRSKEEYFCVFCCKTDGCNKSGSPKTISFSTLPLALLVCLLLNICCRQL